jgi:hypothetical protein
MKYAWFSKKQLSIIANKIKCPYIYYYDMNDKIVQITEIKITREPSLFKDAVYLGPVKKYYASFSDKRTF